ncbi:MAG: hypothetical protein JSV04_02400 [Candidatus Heimdallarchaeota archaeon]|nr:MAG: hypothetical protein JSV04_02400 [Candidatus Heimdallarchaeota archaeon]
MKRTLVVIIIIYILVLINPIVPKQMVGAQTVGNFRLDQITWTGTQVPGITDIPLQLQIMNLHNASITSIFGVLMLPFPFTDAVDGDNNATAVGETLSNYINVSQYTVLTGEPFELVFSLDISVNAKKGLYNSNLELNYFIKSGDSVSPGPPLIIPIELEIPNSPPDIDWVRPTAGSLEVEPGEEINFTVMCSDADNDTLEYEWVVDGSSTNNSKSSFLFTSQQEVGVQEIVLIVSDDNTSITRTWDVEIQIPSETSLVLDTRYLAAGTTTSLQANIINNLWRGKVEIELQIPPPLVIQSNSSWDFLNVTEGENLFVPIEIFTPLTAMGSTGDITFIVQYSDKHGTSYIETVSQGMIIQGLVRVAVFSSEIIESTTYQGGNIEISATLLNTGNTNALFTNASLQSQAGILVDTEGSKSYLGEIEPDSPLPFSIIGTVNSTAPLGNHTIYCVIYYQDDLYNVHELVINFTISIDSSLKTSNDVVSDIDLVSLVLGSGITILLGGGTVLAIFLVVFRRRSVK